MDELIKEINNFKRNIDPELSHLDLSEFIESVALTPEERKKCKHLIKRLEKK